MLNGAITFVGHSFEVRDERSDWARAQMPPLLVSLDLICSESPFNDLTESFSGH